jgi:hypothetical protein
MVRDKFLFIFITLSMIQCNVVVPSSPKREEGKKKTDWILKQLCLRVDLHNN